jgi:hypothetical protein
MRSRAIPQDVVSALQETREVNKIGLFPGNAPEILSGGPDFFAAVDGNQSVAGYSQGDRSLVAASKMLVWLLLCVRADI